MKRPKYILGDNISKFEINLSILSKRIASQII